MGVRTYLDLLQIFCGRESFYLYTQYEVPTLEVSIWNLIMGVINKCELFPLFLQAILIAFSSDQLLLELYLLDLLEANILGLSTWWRQLAPAC